MKFEKCLKWLFIFQYLGTKYKLFHLRNFFRAVTFWNKSQRQKFRFNWVKYIYQ